MTLEHYLPVVRASSPLISHWPKITYLCLLMFPVYLLRFTYSWTPLWNTGNLLVASPAVFLTLQPYAHRRLHPTLDVSLFVQDWWNQSSSKNHSLTRFLILPVPNIHCKLKTIKLAFLVTRNVSKNNFVVHIEWIFCKQTDLTPTVNVVNH